MYDPYAPGAAARPGRPTRFWVLLGVGIAAIAAVVVIFVLLTYGAFGSGAPRPYFGFWGGFFLLFLLVWVGFFVIRMAFWSSRRAYGNGGYGRSPGMRRDPAVMVARQRYARGEISREQYDQIMTDLGRRGRGPGGPLSGG